MKAKTVLWTAAVYALSSLCYFPMLLQQSGAAVPAVLLNAKNFFVIVPAAVSAIFLARERSGKAYWFRCFKRVSLPEIFLCLAVAAIGSLTALVRSFAEGANLFSAAYPSFLPLAFSCVYLFATALMEELAWRGFLFRRLSSERGVLPAALLTGVIWAFWHIPMWTVRNGLGFAEILPLLLWAVLLAVILGAVYARFENLLSAALLHMLCNVCFLAPAIWNDTVIFPAVILYFAYQKSKKVKEYSR